MRKLIPFLLFAILISCSEYSKVLKSTDPEYKYQKAVEYYENDECYKALPLLEELIGPMKGTEKADDVYYYYAQVHYCLGQNYLANFYFKNFTKSYPNSEFTEECQFLAAMCSFKNSPKYSLDQSETKMAIEEFQLFLNRYPNSSLTDSCNTMIGSLREKLEKKAYENAIIFHTTEKYKASVISLEYFLKDYPYSQYKESVMFKLVESHFLYADNSIETKKKERYEDCMESYLTFVAAFPESKNRRQAENYFERSRRYIENH